MFYRIFGQVITDSARIYWVLGCEKIASFRVCWILFRILPFAPIIIASFICTFKKSNVFNRAVTFFEYRRVFTIFKKSIRGMKNIGFFEGALEKAIFLLSETTFAHSTCILLISLFIFQILINLFIWHTRKSIMHLFRLHLYLDFVLVFKQCRLRNSAHLH